MNACILIVIFWTNGFSTEFADLPSCEAAKARVIAASGPQLKSVFCQPKWAKQ